MRRTFAAAFLCLVLGAIPAGVRGQQQDSVIAPAIRDSTCADTPDTTGATDTTDTTRGPERQPVRRRNSMDHNEIAAPRLDNIPLEGTGKGFIPIPDTAADSLKAGACKPKRKTTP
ncbi:MAG TPA: hypothetical protein VLK88_09500 [Gemmatimonadales bacterium]|nr:hypothetical protein [Gemmatimonadales bacterium]